MPFYPLPLETSITPARYPPPGSRPPQPMAAYAAPMPALPQIPTVGGVLNEWGPWTPGLVLLGVADDGIPTTGRLWQRWRTRLNHLLIWGADESILLRLLEPMLYSMEYQTRRFSYNDPMGLDVWQFFIFTPRPASVWHPAVANSVLCRGIHPPDPAVLEEAFGRLAGAVRLRQQRGPTHEGREYWPWLIFVLDDLGQYYPDLSQKARVHLHSLLAEGHKVGIHVFVTSRYADAERLPHIPAHSTVYGTAQGVNLAALPQFRGLEALQTLPPHRMYIPAEGYLMGHTAPTIG